MSAARLKPIVAEIDIAAPIETVWEVMTAEASVPNWLGCTGYRRELGAVFYMQPDAAKAAKGDTSGATHCRVLLLEPPKRLHFAWFIPGTPETIVEITLHARGSRTELRLTHKGWDQFPPEMVKPFHDQLKSGWTSAVLPNLKRAVEG